VCFMCVQGRVEQGVVHVSTVKDFTWWRAAQGERARSMTEAAAMLSKTSTVKDVAALKGFTPTETADYLTKEATLATVYQLTSLHQILEGQDTALCQLNHVYIMPPERGESITTNDGSRLWSRFHIWDPTGKVALYVRAKAMLQIAGLQESETAEYKEQFENDELRHHLLVSVRVFVQKKKGKADEEIFGMDDAATTADMVSATVVEAQACKCNDLPNESLKAIYRLQATDGSQSTERLAACPIRKRGRHKT